jgi:hypothetical protein
LLPIRHVFFTGGAAFAMYRRGFKGLVQAMIDTSILAARFLAVFRLFLCR